VADELVVVYVVYSAFVIDVFARMISAGAQRVRDERRDPEVAPFKCTRFRTFFSSWWPLASLAILRLDSLVEEG